MNSQDFFNKLETMEDKDIMSFISASIEYLIGARDCDFNKIIKHLKKCHNFVVKMNRSEK
jgi:hypothetical protein